QPAAIRREHLKGEVMFFFSSRRRHTSCLSDWSSDVCSSDLCANAASSSGVIVLVEYLWKSGSYCRHVSIGSLSSAPPTKKSSSRSEERRVGKECRARGSRCE